MSCHQQDVASVVRVIARSSIGPHNTGDKLRSSIACAGFVCFIPLFGRTVTYETHIGSPPMVATPAPYQTVSSSVPAPYSPAS